MASSEEISQAIATLERQRGLLETDILETTLAALRHQLAKLDSNPRLVTLLHVELHSNHASTDTTATGQLLSALYTLQMQFKAIAAHYGARIDPKSGYSLVATFVEDPTHAIDAAFDIQDELHSYNVRLAARATHATPAFVVKIGIHTMSSDPSGEATAHHRHITKRITEAATLNDLLISQTTYQQVRGHCTVHNGPILALDELANPLQTYHAIRRKSSLFHNPLQYATDQPAITTSLVGRATELRYLQDNLRLIINDHQSTLITLVGEIGVGKTRLLKDYWDWLDSIPESVWTFFGRATADMVQQPYGLLQSLLAYRARILQSDSLHIIQAKIVRTLTEYLGDDNIHKAHFIGHLTGLDFSTSHHLAETLHDARQIHDRAFHYFVQYIEAMLNTADYPLVFILEDIQWADDGTLELLRYMTHQLPHHPILIIATARPDLEDTHPEWLNASTRLDLAPLSERATRLLVGEILRNVPTPPKQLIEMIVQESMGSPFYIWELVQLLIQEGVIIPTAERWLVQESLLSALTTLPTLPDIVRARLMNLTQHELESLQRAAVIGRTFWDKAIAELAAEEDPNTPKTTQALESLVAHQLITPQLYSIFANTTEYSFGNAILHQLVYDETPANQRARYHARAATWLIGHSMQRIGHYAAIIANHYRRAGEIQRAVKWYTMAGKQAQELYAPITAIRHYQAALELLPTVAANIHQRTVLLKGLGKALTLQAKLREATQVYEEIIRINPDPATQALALNELSVLLNRMGEAQAALQSAIQAESLARQANQPTELARAWLTEAKTWSRLGNRDRAMSLARQSLELANSLQDQFLVADSFNLMGSLALVNSEYEMAQTYLNRALEVVREMGNRRHEGVLANNIAEIARLRGDYQTALILFQEAEKVAAETGNRRSQMVTLHNIATTWIALGQYRTAAKILERLIPEAEQADYSELLTDLLCQLAEAQVGLGETAAALTSAQRALTLAQRTNVVYQIAAGWQVLGEVAAAHQAPISIDDTLYTARQCYAQSLERFTKLQLEAAQAKTRQLWALYELKHGDPAQGQLLWHEAIKWFKRIGADYEIQRMKSSLDLADED